MADDIKAGDRFLVEVEVKGEPVYGPYPVKVKGGVLGASITLDVLLAAKRLPRALKVGDRVRYETTGMIGNIVAIADGLAWVRWDRDGDLIYGVDDLTPAEAAP